MGVIQALCLTGSFVCLVFVSGLERVTLNMGKLQCAAVKIVGRLRRNCLYFGRNVLCDLC